MIEHLKRQRFSVAAVYDVALISEASLDEQSATVIDRRYRKSARPPRP